MTGRARKLRFLRRYEDRQRRRALGAEGRSRLSTAFFGLVGGAVASLIAHGTSNLSLASVIAVGACVAVAVTALFALLPPTHPFVRLGRVAVAIVLVLFGLAIGWLPGPGGFLAIVGLFMLAGEFRRVAVFADWCEDLVLPRVQPVLRRIRWVPGMGRVVEPADADDGRPAR